MDQEARLDAIFNKTDGRCRFCGKQLCRSNYGKRGRRGAWVQEHSRSVANGGTTHLNNLFAACYECNEDKSGTNAASYKRRRRKQGKHVAKRSWWTGRYQ